jgi:uncharacterized membrane protein SpoIIM required for sporulation
MGATGRLAPRPAALRSAALRSAVLRSASVSVALAAVALTLVTVVAAAAGGDLAERNAVALAAGDLDTSVLAGDRDAASIALRNVGAVALLAAGAPMLGTLTLVAVPVLGIGLGLSAAAVVGALGPVEALQRVAPYIAFELTGVVLAAAAGILPTVHALVTAARDPASLSSSYATALPASLGLTLVAALLIVIAACIEAVVIAAHPH